MPPDISIVVPVLNGASRLPALLDALKRQKTSEVEWETIVVDNNSSDETSAVIDRFRRDWRPDVAFRSVFEPRAGLAWARRRGVDEARGQWVAFLDDDTRPDPDWVAAALRFGRDHPRAGVFGGRIRIRISGGIPPAFSRLAVYFCETELGPTPRRFRTEILEMPVGAGMVVRRDAWRTCVPRELMFPIRAGNDLEAGLHIHHGGWEVWYAPSMALVHQVDPDRLTSDNLARMMKRYGGQSFSLRAIGKQGLPRFETRLRVLFGGAYRVLRLLILESHRMPCDRFCRADLIFWCFSMLSALRPAASPPASFLRPGPALSDSTQNVPG